MKKILKPENVFEDLSLFSIEELKDLVFHAINLNGLLRQTILVKSAIKHSKKEVNVLKNIIDEAFAYERPNKDPDWGKYDAYFDEIKKSILSLDKDLSLSELKEVLSYLAEQAADDEIIGEFDEDGEWGLAIDDINEHISGLEE
jgi:hypothetical protein